MLEGLPPNNAATLLRLVCDERTARAATDAVVEFFDPAETAAAAFEDDASPDNPKPWLLEIYLGPLVAASAVRSVLAHVIGQDQAEALAIEAVEEQDWVAASLSGLTPVRAGRFLIHGRHGRDALKANDIGLEIEAALAFGTGHHGTTRGCLLCLDAILRRRRPRRVLDLGTGTGVLAMAAAKVLRRRVEAGDLDPQAVAAASGNARLNGVAAFVRPVAGAGLNHAVLRRGGPYDLIFANILARPLRRLAPSIAEHAAPGADLILSGLLPPDAPGVLSAYATQGFRSKRRRDLDGWVTLAMRKPAGADRGRCRASWARPAASWSA